MSLDATRRYLDLSTLDVSLRTNESLSTTPSEPVTDNSGNPIEGVRIRAWDYDTDDYYGSTWTDAEGNYSVPSLGALPTGNYRVQATHGDYVDEYYDNQMNWGDATPVVVNDPDNTPNVNFSLGIGGSITGTVEDESGNPKRQSC